MANQTGPTARPSPSQILALARQFARRSRAGHPLRAAQFLLRDGRALLRDRLLPSEARLLREHRDEVRAVRDRLYLQIEHQRHLAPFRKAIAAAGLHDKGMFADFCADHGLPHPRTARIGSRNPAAVEAALASLNSDAVIAKPAIGSGGYGLALLRRLDADRWELKERGKTDGRVATAAALLADHCSGHDLVIQPVLSNHRDLAALAGPVLATFRVVTGPERSPDGSRGTGVISMLAELPLDEKEPIPGGWAILPVDPVAGRLAATRAELPPAMPAEAVVRAQAYGASTIAAASEIAALAVHAHRVVTDVYGNTLPPMIGWDMALTRAGPIVLEPNWNWAIAPHYCNLAGFDLSLSDQFGPAA